MTERSSPDIVDAKHMRRIIAGLFNPMPDGHEKGCLHNDPHIHPRGPCICRYSKVAGEYLWSLREAKKIAAEHFGEQAVENSRRLQEPSELVEAASLRSPDEAATPQASNYFTGKAHKILVEACGHPENWTKYDHALLDLAREADDVCSGDAAQLPEQPRWRHKKRGSTYTEVGRGNLQIATDPVEEDDRVVIYRADVDGRLWVRGEAEFQDGRFEALPMSSTQTEAGK